MIRPVVILLEIHADNPLYKRLRDLSHLIIYKAQQISRFYMVFIQVQALLQILYRTCQISYSRQFQPGIVKAVGNQADSFHLIHSYRLFFHSL
jgi:hypothetical protein